ncbi:hypothetical protein QBC47DRAFT_180401 [Echria macrotheca]|uniref:Uncharacterized protein n=1 Tax=Echria macrotheca TaxID=438768 RepID=A0AAJ0F5U1_9PEZI|nr:hypothetical protein QBC47DRAFT_180401 [Echria macrotheca]
MPTVYPSQHAAETWGKRGPAQSRYTLSTSPEQLLATITTNDGDMGKVPRLVQSSFTDLDRTSTTFATKNGFVHACIEAYNEHHNLVLRPEDVWFAILTQLSSYVNANAEELRSQFVAHDGQKELHIEVELTPDLDHGAMAFEMTKLMGANITDPALRDWILPAFSTTEKTDQAVASIIFMGTLQKYFTYSWGTRCGIPAVTLLGEEDDWIEIAERCAARLGSGKFGPEAFKWYRVLRPVLAGFIETFQDPDGPGAKKFWQSIVDEHKPNGSGSTTYSGWITAFCYWDEEGNCLHRSSSGWGPLSRIGGGSDTVRLTRSQIPMGFTKVPVTLINSGVKIPTEMIAGSVGLRVRKWEDEDAGKGSPRSDSGSNVSGAMYRQRFNGYDTLQPESGWFMQFVAA